VREVSSLRHQVEDLLRRAIASGRFRPGQHLVERELCEATGVSRPSIREALRRLEAEGLITVIPHRGPMVATVTRADAEQIYGIRAVLEGFAAHQFALAASETDIGRLRHAVDALERAAAGGPGPALVEAKAAFYKILFAGCGNAYVERMLSPLLNRMSILRMTSMAQRDRLPHSLAEIRAICAAIERRDADAARAASEAHVRNAAAVALAALAVPTEAPLEPASGAGAPR
jgi:DNA-binding GntR family transcriptional regulator